MGEGVDKENEERTVLKGFLLVPAWALVRKSWNRKFCVLFDTSPQGVRRLEVFDSEEQLAKGHSGKILVLEDAVKIHTMAKNNKETNVFEITTEKRTFQLRTENAKELSEWVEKLRKVCFPEKQSIANMSSNKPKSNGYSVKENDLYGAVEDSFCVKLISTPASEKCGLDPSELNYVIVLTPDSMILKFGDLNNFYVNDDQADKTIYEWHYPFIRRYGIVNGFFSFEAGRKCLSGEGLFSFDAPDVRKIFERLASFMKLAGEKRKHMKTASSPVQISEDSTQSAKTKVSEKVPQDENCEGCKKLSNANSDGHEQAILFGRACAVPQTPISSAVYANVTDLETVSVEHIVVGDGVEYARVVKSATVVPPPPPPIQKITRMDSVEKLEGAC